jgi:alginate O-acetyltransferase complex protein AlgI
MLFCTPEFLEFFCVIFAAYWALRWPWARRGLVLLAGGYIVHGVAKALPAATAFGAYPAALGHFLAGPGMEGWLAVLLLGGAVLSGLLGVDRGRVWFLFGASFYFYASWSHWLAIIVCVSTAVDYLLARGMEASHRPALRRALVSVSIVGNLGLLCYFKYANFFLESLEQALHAAGAAALLPRLSVILPIGISFYTFEAINYTVDVYRRKVPAERSLPNFMLFILFFPHLVAGPIVRARDFLPQIRRRKHWDWARMHLGAQYVLMGLFKKLAIADRMALYADPVFADPAAYGSAAAWLATLAYALQIYCDFSGYSDMALGCAHMLGYRLTKNFNMPYVSANISEFWRRWHMSLSTWLRDYLFIPLGGSRGTPRQTNRNLLITMTLGGLWHGANWTFVAWGVLHGLLLVGHRRFRDACKTRPVLDRVLQSGPGTLLRVGVTFLCVALCWVFFRSSTFGGAAAVLYRLAGPHGGQPPPLPARGLVYTLIAVALCHVVARSGGWRKLADRLPAPALGLGYAAVLTAALVLTPELNKAFIYFQF